MGRPSPSKRPKLDPHRNRASVQAFGEMEETASAHSSRQAIGQPPSPITEESVGIPIRGSLALKTFQSNVVYCLTFSQDFSPHALSMCERSVRRGGARSKGNKHKRRSLARKHTLDK